MPRHRRLEIPGGVYHVITRGINRGEIFRDETDRREFLSRLERALEQTKCLCYGWALMPNHFHLVLKPVDRPLSDTMRKVLSGYAVYFNRRHKRHGYLYQNRYKSILCQEDKYLLELVRYVHLNPVRAKLVDLAGLDSYPWTGHAVLMGNLHKSWQDADEVLRHFAKTAGPARKAYRQFMEDGLSMGKRPDLTGGGLKRSAGGWEGVKALKKAQEYWRGDERVLGEGEFVDRSLQTFNEQVSEADRLRKEGWTLDRLVDAVCEQFGVERKDLVKRGRENRLSEAKALIAYYAHRKLGVSSTVLAELFGCSRQAAHKTITTGEKLSSTRPFIFTLLPDQQ